MNMLWHTCKIMHAYTLLKEFTECRENGIKYLQTTYIPDRMIKNQATSKIGILPETHKCPQHIETGQEGTAGFGEKIEEFQFQQYR